MPSRINNLLHIGFLLPALLLLRCGSSNEKMQTLPAVVDPPDHLSIHPRIALYDSSSLKALITAGRARAYFKHRYTLLDRGVTVDFFDPAGHRQSRLSADSILIDDNSQHMMAAGNVTVHAANPPTLLQTSRLFWDKRSRQLYTPDSVTVETPTEKIFAIGFESDERLQNYTFRNVRMVIQKQKEE